MNVSVSALSAFLMTTFVCGKNIGGGRGLWNKRHTHNATPVCYRGTVRQGLHNPSCRSVATDKGDVLRPLLIHHSGKGRYYTCCLHIIALGWEPHTFGNTHDRVHTQTKQAQTARCTDRPTQIRQIYTHILTAKSQIGTRAPRRTLCDTLPHWVKTDEGAGKWNLTQQFKTQHCSTASVGRTKRPYFSKLPQYRAEGASK